ncbi:DUF1289 domain-containing protein [Shinella zoogloeoides]
MESPCILVCSIDTETGYCLGCGRTREEIGAWTRYTSDERRSLMATLPARLTAITRQASMTERRA